MSDTQLTVVDQQTGEVVPIPETEIIRKSSFVESTLKPLFGESTMPLHLAMLHKLNADPESLELVMSLYHQEALPFSKVSNMTLPVYGMLIVEHGPYNGMDGQYHPEGFYQILFLVEIKDEMKVVKSSSPGLLELAATIIHHRGGGLFPEPVSYLFSIGDDKRHRIYNISLDMKRLRRKSNV